MAVRSPETERRRAPRSAERVEGREDDGLVVVDVLRQVRLIDHRAKEILGGLLDLGDTAPGLILASERVTLRGSAHGGAEVIELRVRPTRVDAHDGWAIGVADVSARRAPEDAAAELVAAVCHELRTPLGGIVGYADVLRVDGDGLDAATRDRFLGVILRQAERMGRLIEDLLSLSRPGRGLDVRTERVLLEAAVHETLELLGGDAIEVAGLGEVTVLVDGHHLQNILTNLLTNARKYGRDPIVVELGRLGDEGIVWVRDAGPGVPEGFVDRMWERFSRARSSNDPGAPRGSGIGLSVVAGLAAANGGRAWYERGEPSGACFGVAFPLAGASQD